MRQMEYEARQKEHLAPQKGLESFERVKELLDVVSPHQNLRAPLLQMQGTTNSLHNNALQSSHCGQTGDPRKNLRSYRIYAWRAAPHMWRCSRGQSSWPTPAAPPRSTKGTISEVFEGLTVKASTSRSSSGTHGT